jgi:LEA14-like dessication related protein
MATAFLDHDRWTAGTATSAPARPDFSARSVRRASYGIRKGAAAGCGRRLLTAAALVLAAFLGGCAAPAVDVALVGLAPMESSLLEQRLRLDFRVLNPSRRAISATGLDVVLDVNGRQLARGVDSGAFRLDPLSETEVSAVVSTSILEIVRQLLTLVERDRFDYQLRGRIYVDGWPRSLGFTRSGVITRKELERLAGIGGRTPAPLRLDRAVAP